MTRAKKAKSQSIDERVPGCTQKQAWDRLNAEVRAGRLEKPSICVVCDLKEKLWGHHWRGYEYPLDVWWVCSSCNRLLTVHDGTQTLEDARAEMPGLKAGGGYEAYRAGQGITSLAKSAKGRDIGGIPPIANIRRRGRCRKSLRWFCETYNPQAFTLAWSKDHLRVIDRIEEAATLGALYALAMPRGSGKTTLCRMAGLWAVGYRHCRYVYLIGANATKAEDSLNAVKMFVRYLPEFAADFPEISWPAVCLGGIAHRAAGQTCGGESTLIEWSSERLILPTVRPPENWPKSWPLREDGKAPTSGTIIGTSGLTGDGIRGSVLTLTTGEQVRPDLVILDDPQSAESAHSVSQNATREQLVGADVLGMAGPGKSIAAVMPCTVIAQNDFADRILDRKKHPLWRGERTKLLKTMPVNLAAWEEYFEVYRECAQLEPPDYTRANVYYIDNRETLDAGAESSWAERKLPGEVSAIQHAMNLYCRGRRTFFAEYQNDPLGDESTPGRVELLPAAIAARLTNVPRGDVPRECSRLTAFVDCSKALLWYVVAGWDERFGGSVVDYGAWPRQSRSYFEQSNATPTLADLYPGLIEEARLYAGLRDLTAALFTRRFVKTGNDTLTIELCLVDSGWNTDTVFKFCREAQHSALLLPSKGYGASTAARSVDEWLVRQGERRGPGWRLGPDTTSGKGRRVAYDANHWKTFIAQRLLTRPASPGCLMLPGDSAHSHQMLADHLTAEYAEPITARGRTWDAWMTRPDRVDNHWWDCLTGAAVAASVRGLVWDPSGTVRPEQNTVPTPRKVADQQVEARRRGPVNAR